MLDFINYYWLFLPAFLLVLSIAISASFLSPFMVLNEQALIADGLAHMSFTGIILGVLLVNEPFIIAVPFAIIGTLIVNLMKEKGKLSGDAALGLVSSVLVAIGLVIVNKTEGFPISVESILVGNMWQTKTSDVFLSIIVSAIIVVFISVFYKKLLLITYDEEFAKFKKLNVFMLKSLLAVLTALFTVLGVKTIGTLLISALLIFPSALSNLFAKSFKQTLIYGVIMSIGTIIIGFILAHLIDLPTAATIIILYAVLGISIISIQKIRGVRNANDKK